MTTGVVLGDHRDAAAVLEFGKGVDVLTFDHEHVPQPVLAELEDAGIATDRLEGTATGDPACGITAAVMSRFSYGATGKQPST